MGGTVYSGALDTEASGINGDTSESELPHAQERKKADRITSADSSILFGVFCHDIVWLQAANDTLPPCPAKPVNKSSQQ